MSGEPPPGVPGELDPVTRGELDPVTRGEQAIARVREALERAGLGDRVRTYPASTATSEQAAQAVGCRVSQIAKSVVFRAGERACLVVAPGDRRVSAAKLRAALGSKVSVATAEFVLGCTGFEPGGVSPLGHQGALRVMIDAALLQEPAVWIAAGSRWSVARLSPQELIALSGGQVLDLSEGG